MVTWMGNCRSGATPAFVAAAAVAICGSATAQDSVERMAAAASGFAVAPPQGYVAAADPPSSASEIAISLTRIGEPDTRCRVSFEAIPGFSQFTQDELNRQADQPNFELFYRESVGGFYAIATVAHFDHAGVRGAAMRATSLARPATPGWRADLPAMIFMFYTPHGLTKLTCTTSAALFAARRSAFEAVAAAVTLPQ